MSDEFKGPIVEGAYYEREDGKVVGPARRDGTWWQVGGYSYDDDGAALWATAGVGYALRLTRRVYITHTDPAEVVAELRRRSDEMYDEEPYPQNVASAQTWAMAADLVAEKLGVKP